MNNKQILEQAPEGWTHYQEIEGVGVYWDIRLSNDHNIWYDTEDDGLTYHWFATDSEPSYLSTRSRTDIERIVELERKLEASQSAGMLEFYINSLDSARAKIVKLEAENKEIKS